MFKNFTSPTFYDQKRIGHDQNFGHWPPYVDVLLVYNNGPALGLEEEKENATPAAPASRATTGISGTGHDSRPPYTPWALPFPCVIEK